MGILKNILFLIPAVLMSSCLETFTPDVEVKEVLCLNSLIKAGDTIKIEVTHSWFYPDGKNSNHWYPNNGSYEQGTEGYKPFVDDARIRIFSNDKEVYKDYIPKEGDKLKILAKSEKYGEAESEVIVPYGVPVKPKIVDFILKSDNDFSNEDYRFCRTLIFDLKLEVEITDNSTSTDYYHIDFNNFSVLDNILPPIHPDTLTSFVSYYNGILKYEAEPLFYEHLGEFESIYEIEPDGFSFFTDRTFSGSTYNLKLEFENCRYYVQSEFWDPDFLDCGINIYLSSISESYYNWENYFWQVGAGFLGDLTDWGFVDPIWGYSNVSTGAGVVAAETETAVAVNLKDYLKDFFE